MTRAWCLLSLSTRSLRVLGVAICPAPSMPSPSPYIWNVPVADAGGTTFEDAIVNLRKQVKADPKMEWLHHLVEGRGGGRRPADYNLTGLANRSLRGVASPQDVADLAQGVLDYQKQLFGD